MGTVRDITVERVDRRKVDPTRFRTGLRRVGRMVTAHSPVATHWHSMLGSRTGKGGRRTASCLLVNGGEGCGRDASGDRGQM